MKNKTLIVTLIALLVSNIIFAYLLLDKKKHRGRIQMIERQMKQIGFDKAQTDSFIAIRETSREKMGPTMDSLQASRSRYIDALTKNPNDSLTIFSLLNESNKWVYKMDMQNYVSLVEARKICKPEQITAYDSLVKERMQYRNGRRNKK